MIYTFYNGQIHIENTIQISLFRAPFSQSSNLLSRFGRKVIRNFFVKDLLSFVRNLSKHLTIFLKTLLIVTMFLSLVFPTYSSDKAGHINNLNGKRKVFKKMAYPNTLIFLYYASDTETILPYIDKCFRIANYSSMNYRICLPHIFYRVKFKLTKHYKREEYYIIKDLIIKLCNLDIDYLRQNLFNSQLNSHTLRFVPYVNSAFKYKSLKIKIHDILSNRFKNGKLSSLKLSKNKRNFIEHDRFLLYVANFLALYNTTDNWSVFVIDRITSKSNHSFDIPLNLSSSDNHFNFSRIIIITPSNYLNHIYYIGYILKKDHTRIRHKRRKYLKINKHSIINFNLIKLYSKSTVKTYYTRYFQAKSPTYHSQTVITLKKYLYSNIRFTMPSPKNIRHIKRRKRQSENSLYPNYEQGNYLMQPVKYFPFSNILPKFDKDEISNDIEKVNRNDLHHLLKHEANQISLKVSSSAENNFTTYNISNLNQDLLPKHMENINTHKTHVYSSNTHFKLKRDVIKSICQTQRYGIQQPNANPVNINKPKNIVKRGDKQIQMLKKTYLSFCDAYPVYNLLSQQDLFSIKDLTHPVSINSSASLILQNFSYISKGASYQDKSDTETINFKRSNVFDSCKNTLKKLNRLDTLIKKSTKDLHSILTRIDCDMYSINWNCSECENAYKLWLCSVRLPYYIGSDKDTPISPCSDFCDLVLNRCPYLLPQFEYGGEPTFICDNYSTNHRLKNVEEIRQCYSIRDMIPSIPINNSVPNKSIAGNFKSVTYSRLRFLCPKMSYDSAYFNLNR
ncbi:unnamed protein product [Gordionus sp. m RMFG-2023]|uniref:uncharacterized protein LOC135931357 isoform X2 n=1 Tax=Gordionus sp. m RMFG-2023 TaxID=3053472 RepID=UPI0030E4C15F